MKIYSYKIIVIPGISLNSSQYDLSLEDLLKSGEHLKLI